MKKILLFVMVIALSTVMSAGFGQVNAKLGYIDSNELLELMPGKDSIQTALQDYQKTLETQLQTMYAEYQTKVQDYQTNSRTMSDIIRQTKEKELADLETRIQTFQQQADTDLQNKQVELLQPLLDKAKNAINAVAKENGYTYIFDVGTGAFLFYEKGDNILPLVKAKLGLK
ncbi:MAG TPA: OmpH family outer membrane protein [Bacteroidales bacterium]|nr:OmpH family outer membrane protein [Bacteroidales bacterium]HNQ82289.1 OmpH family outer membrane protein [Bacteroidales bacterium]HOX77579.1 OmpH family outer membrane protein [Bacteroidales bacterium]HPM92144.1 OmpH family outer membrane protein [Bacteroidales bacterium]